MFSLILQEQPEEIGDLGVIWVLLEEGSVKRFGLGYIARLVQQDGLIQTCIMCCVVLHGQGLDYFEVG